MMKDGSLLVTEGNRLILVEAIHQDALGNFYYKTSLYGDCPRGHPYPIEGGCTGINCPFSDP